MKNTVIAIICALSLAFLWKKYNSQTQPKLSKHNSYLSCQGKTFDVTANFNGELILLKEGLPHGEEALQNFLYASIIYQNRYTFLNIVKINKGSDLKFLTPGTSPEITINKQEDAIYPFHVELEHGLPIHNFMPEQQIYLKSALENDKSFKGKPAVKVSYTYKNQILGCMGNKKDTSDLSSLNYYMPNDPYLAYFVVPLIQRRSLINPISKTETIANPCLEPDTMSSVEVDPFAFWYHWNPVLEGRDKNKTPFNCSLFYKQDSVIKNVKISFQENPPKAVKFPDFSKFEALNRPIKVSVLMSANNDYVHVDYDQKEVSDLVGKFLSGIPIKEANAQLPINTASKYDVNLSKILLFIWTLQNQIEVFNYQVNAKGPVLEIVLKSKLKLSKKDMEIRITLSHNGLEAGKNFFAEHFANDLLTRDIVIYEGHAGLGSTFSAPLQLLNDQNRKFDKDLNYQILALHSCFASLYFNEQQFPAPPRPGFQRSFITTGGDFKDITANGSIALISTLDTYLYNESYVPFGEWAKNFQSDNLYILSDD